MRISRQGPLITILVILLLIALVSSFQTHLAPDLRDCRSFGQEPSLECLQQINQTLQAEASAWMK